MICRAGRRGGDSADQAMHSAAQGPAQIWPRRLRSRRHSREPPPSPAPRPPTLPAWRRKRQCRNRSSCVTSMLPKCVQQRLARSERLRSLLARLIGQRCHHRLRAARGLTHECRRGCCSSCRSPSFESTGLQGPARRPRGCYEQKGNQNTPCRVPIGCCTRRPDIAYRSTEMWGGDTRQ